MAETVFVGEYPKDGENASVGRMARVKAINAFDSNHWDFHEMTGSDIGIDMKFELIENHEFQNNRIECQIKGRTSVDRIKSGSLSAKRVFLEPPVCTEMSQRELNPKSWTNIVE